MSGEHFPPLKDDALQTYASSFGAVSPLTVAGESGGVGVDARDNLNQTQQTNAVYGAISTEMHFPSGEDARKDSFRMQGSDSMREHSGPAR